MLEIDSISGALVTTRPLAIPIARILFLLLLFLLAAAPAHAQQPVTIYVDASRSVGSFEPVWAWVGHDEPNYIYTEEGRALLTELSQLTSLPVHDRTHNLLTSGDGTPALKWGSTNAFALDAQGHPVYDWTIVDKIFDAYKATGIIPFVEIGFMPEALSPHPEPYQHHWPRDFATGWSYPPNDYSEWSELIEHWVRHMVTRYGAAEVSRWEWEVWNEPDIFYWHGTLEDYCKFYDFTVAAVRRALPQARVGGPATTGPANPKAADFLRGFLQHCVDGKNYATGKTGAPLDFISFHAKGKTAFANGHVELNLGKHLRDIDQGFAIIERFSTLRQLPVVLSESDPEGCAACDATAHPENGYRLGAQYASYEAALLNGTLALARRHNIHLVGSITWAFTFPGQPLFAGFRALTSRDLDLPVLNAFRMFGRMNGERIAAESDSAVKLESELQPGAGASADLNAIATRSTNRINVLVWNYQDVAAAAPPASIHLVIRGFPKGASRVRLELWQVDQTHSNAYTAWQRRGSPQNPSPEQYQALRAAGHLQLLDSPQWVPANKDAVEFTFDEPPEGLSLLCFGW